MAQGRGRNFRKRTIALWAACGAGILAKMKQRAYA